MTYTVREAAQLTLRKIDIFKSPKIAIFYLKNSQKMPLKKKSKSQLFKNDIFDVLNP